MDININNLFLSITDDLIKCRYSLPAPNENIQWEIFINEHLKFESNSFKIQLAPESLDEFQFEIINKNINAINYIFSNVYFIKKEHSKKELLFTICLQENRVINYQSKVFKYTQDILDIIYKIFNTPYSFRYKIETQEDSDWFLLLGSTIKYPKKQIELIPDQIQEFQFVVSEIGLMRVSNVYYIPIDSHEPQFLFSLSVEEEEYIMSKTIAYSKTTEILSYLSDTYQIPFSFKYEINISQKLSVKEKVFGVIFIIIILIIIWNFLSS